MSVPRVLDVAVVGGGPAGYAAAIGLARAGRPVGLVAADGRPRDRIGESLSPSANGILKQLGVWQDFVADGHLPCHANRSCWDRDQLDTYDFLRNPHGHAWHIDRVRFEDRLRLRALALGVESAGQTASSIAGHAGCWDLKLRCGASVRARFVIDATGRASWLARRLGIARDEHDRQIALVAFLDAKAEAMKDTSSMVEAVPRGWWYSAPLPGGQFATALFADLDLLDRTSARTASGWASLLGETLYTKARVQDGVLKDGASPQIVAAGSGCLREVAGDGWAAVGDAAVCFDPLSSHGLTIALASGRDAAAAADGWLSGRRDAVQRYQHELLQSYRRYDDIRRRYYRGQRRWPEADYWKRRASGAVQAKAVI